MLCSSHVLSLRLCEASRIVADRDPAGKPGDGGRRTFPGGPLHQRPPQERERRRPPGGQISESNHPACISGVYTSFKRLIETAVM